MHQVRTNAYRIALESNPSLLKGATVLDVGCGTGILSLFARRAGASRVIGIDGSGPIAQMAQEICAANGAGGDDAGPVSIVTGKVEELTELPGVQQVDVLVSEWMGWV